MSSAKETARIENWITRHPQIYVKHSWDTFFSAALEVARKRRLVTLTNGQASVTADVTKIKEQRDLTKECDNCPFFVVTTDRPSVLQDHLQDHHFAHTGTVQFCTYEQRGGAVIVQVVNPVKRLLSICHFSQAQRDNRFQKRQEMSELEALSDTPVNE